VIVPSHNTRALTLRCLDSVFSQWDEVLEVVLVDNGSYDGTALAVGEAFSRVHLLSFSETLGFSRAANAGASSARGEILLFLNSDAELLPGALATVRGVFAERPRLAAVGARLLSEDGAPEWSGGPFPTLAWMLALGSGLPGALASLALYRRLAIRRREGPHERVAAVDWVSGAAIAVREGEFRRAGAFATGFRFYAQDLELCTALRERDLGVAIVDAFRVRHTLGASVSQLPGARGARVDLSRLLPDLVRWGEQRRGEAWGRAAARLLALGLALRVAARRVRAPFSPSARRPAFRAETRRYARACRALVRSIALA
jgi:N-acetylglucosaminyl-diphospho-decaprenol L-rhamnosyltransferase